MLNNVPHTKLRPFSDSRQMKDRKKRKLRARLACLDAEIQAIKTIFNGASKISSYYIDQYIEKEGQRAAILHKLEGE